MPVAYACTLIVLLLIVLILAIKTDILRNVVFDPASFTALAANIKAPKPGYSLSRTQFAFWTIIIIGSAIYIWIFRCACSLNVPMNIDPVNLELLGVSTATIAFGKAIDSSQQNSTAASTVSAQQNQPSKGFLIDILSDETGISIHRLQNVLWSLVIGYWS